jgi:hypothetical protein
MNYGIIFSLFNILCNLTPRFFSTISMKYICLSFLLLVSLSANAQYPSFTLGPDDTLDCRTNCTTLHASYTPSMATTSYGVSQISYNPFPFNTGTDIDLVADDSWSGIIDIPFTFCFMGGNYNSLVIGTNGIVSFNTTYANTTCPWNLTGGETLPNAALPLVSIFCPMQDMNNGNGGTIYIDTIGTAPARVFTISFYQFSYYNCVDTFLTAQVALYETTNIIDIYIESKLVCTSWNGGLAIEGIQDDGNTGFTVPGRNNSVWPASNDAWRFTPNANPNLVRIAWYQGSTLIGAGDNITVCPTTTTTYRANASYTICTGPPTVLSDTITIHAAYLGMQPSHQNVTCFGFNDGFASVNVTGGYPPYTYSWSPNSSVTNTASGLVAGTYTATVTDTTGCYNYTTITITQPPLLTLADSSVATTCSSCNDGIIILTANGGTPGYLYSISPQAGNQIGNFFYNLPSGAYNACVVDMNGCMTCDSTIVDITTGLHPLSSSSELSFYPNPFKDVTALEINSVSGNLHFTITDVFGKIISDSKIISQWIVITRKDIPAEGIYFYRILSANAVIAKGKLVVAD